MDGETLPDGAETAPVTSRLADSIDDLAEDDLLIINDSRRTWVVTDIVDQELDHTDDERLRKRAVRVQTGGDYSSEVACGILLEEYPDRHEAGIHIFTSPHWHEEGKRYELASLDTVETQVPWVVCRTTGSSNVYHFPDPLTAASGEARPACGGCRGEDTDEVEYRIVRVNAVYPAKRACMNCARRHQPREIPKVNCPACGRPIGVGLLHGPQVESVTGVTLECPETDCGFTGEVALDQQGQSPASAD
jgi:hypothetical protein